MLPAKTKKFHFRYIFLSLALFLTLFGFERAFVSAAESASYQLQSSTQSGDSFSSSNYVLCSRIGSVSTNGASSNYVLTAPLYCNESTGGSGGGGGGGSRPHPVCGNGSVDLGEQCDDSNLLNGDGCSEFCSLEEPVSPPPDEPEEPVEPEPEDEVVPPGPSGPLCGNDIRELPEQCDDGNLNSGDGCDALCVRERPETPDEPEEPLDETPVTETPEYVPPVLDDSFPGLLLPVCGNGFEEFGEQCDDGNSFNGDGCNSMCRLEALVYDDLSFFPPSYEGLSPSAPVLLPENTGGSQVYLTNDIEALFFEQIPGGSGDYEISLQGEGRVYAIDVLETSEGYFSFLLLEKLPDGFYTISVVDRQQSSVTLDLRLQVEEQENINPPLLLEFDGQDLSLFQSFDSLQSAELQPIIKGQTHLPATIAFYSTQLDQTFIVYTDEENAFQFQYPEELMAGTFEELRIVAHYENGDISRPQVVRIEILQTPHFVADDSFGSQISIFSILGIMLLFLISTIASLSFFGFWRAKSYRL